MRDKITFETNIWQELALKDPAGVNGSNDYGDFARFVAVTPEGDKTLFLPIPAAAGLRALGLQAGERFKARKAEVKNGGGKPHHEFQFVRLDPPPPQTPAGSAHGELVIPKEAAVASPPAASGAPSNSQASNNGNGSSNGHRPESPLTHSGAAAQLRDQVNMLIDIYAGCCTYASERHGAAVTPDRVWSILATVVIGKQKGEGGR